MARRLTGTGQARHAEPHPLDALDTGRLQRLAALAADLLAGRPLHPGGTLPGRHATNGQDFLDHRAFSAGDDPRRIDWRASARRREPVVRRYRDEHASDWLIALDRSASMGVVTGAWPLAVQLAAAVAYVLTTHGHRALMALFSDRLDATAGPGRCPTTLGAIHALLRHSAPQFPAERLHNGLDAVSVPGARRDRHASRPESCLPLAHRRRVLLISDCLRPDGMTDALATLSGPSAGVELLRIATPLPEVTAGQGLVDAETGERRTPPHDVEIVEVATANAERLFEALAVDCRRLGVPLTVARVGLSWEQALLPHLLSHWRAPSHVAGVFSRRRLDAHPERR